MKAISINQPYPQLVVMGIKKFETRSWPCPPALINQPLIFHATKHLVPLQMIGDWKFVPLGDEALMYLPHEHEVHLPLGAVVGSGRVAACLPILDADELLPDGWDTSQDALFVGKDGLWRDSQWEIGISDQLPYGDFTPGRFAWLIEDAAPTTERCPWCDGLGRIHDTFGIDEDLLDFETCPVCAGAGHCESIPARGHQRIWSWSP